MKAQIGFALLILGACFTPTEGKARYDFHGLLFRCSGHPTVQVSGHVAYAYEADLTRYTEGRAIVRKDAVIVSFPGRYGRFTIAKHGARFMSDGVVCMSDGL